MCQVRVFHKWVSVSQHTCRRSGSWASSFFRLSIKWSLLPWEFSPCKPKLRQRHCLAGESRSREDLGRLPARAFRRNDISGARFRDRLRKRSPQLQRSRRAGCSRWCACVESMRILSHVVSGAFGGRGFGIGWILFSDSQVIFLLYSVANP